MSQTEIIGGVATALIAAVFTYLGIKQNSRATDAGQVNAATAQDNARDAALYANYGGYLDRLERRLDAETKRGDRIEAALEECMKIKRELERRGFVIEDNR